MIHHPTLTLSNSAFYTPARRGRAMTRLKLMRERVTRSLVFDRDVLRSLDAYAAAGNAA